METFNQLVILDQGFADRLPQREFELAFDSAGNIYIDGKPFGANLQNLYKSLAVK